MNNFEKTTFDRSVISSAFLNSLQDFIIARGPKLVPYEEDDDSIPTGQNTAYLPIQGILFGRYGYGTEFDIMPGDVLLGVPSGRLAVVMGENGQDMFVRGLNVQLGS